MNIERIQQIMIKKNQTTSGLAKHLGISYSSARNKVSGRKKIWADEVPGLADYLGITNLEEVWRLFLE